MEVSQLFGAIDIVQAWILIPKLMSGILFFFDYDKPEVNEGQK